MYLLLLLDSTYDSDDDIDSPSPTSSTTPSHKIPETQPRQDDLKESIVAEIEISDVIDEKEALDALELSKDEASKSYGQQWETDNRQEAIRGVEQIAILNEAEKEVALESTETEKEISEGEKQSLSKKEDEDVDVDIEKNLQHRVLTRKQRKLLEKADLSVLDTVFPEVDTPRNDLQNKILPKSVTFSEDTKPGQDFVHSENTTRKSTRLKAQKAGLKYDRHGIQLPLHPRPKRASLVKGPHQIYLDSITDVENLSPVPIPSPMAFAVQARTDEDERTPSTLKEAMLGPNREEWIESILEEFESINHHEVYRWAPCPENVKPLNSGFVFRIKPAADGKPERFKTRVVVRGNEQKEGYHFDGSALYAPVVKQKSLRFTCALAVQLGMELHKMDIKTAFLHGDLEETLYLKPPIGIVCPPGKQGWVWELKKALYGLKQAPRQWNLKLHHYMSKDLGFTRLESDWGIYIKREGKTLTIVDIYVDD